MCKRKKGPWEENSQVIYTILIDIKLTGENNWNELFIFVDVFNLCSRAPNSHCEFARLRKIAKRSKFASLRFAQNGLDFASLSLRNFWNTFAFASLSQFEPIANSQSKICENFIIFRTFFQVFGLDFIGFLFKTLNIALITIKCSDNSINPFLEVKFRRIRVFGGCFGFLDKFWLGFDNFVDLPTISAKKKTFLKTSRV